MSSRDVGPRTNVTPLQVPQGTSKDNKTLERKATNRGSGGQRKGNPVQRLKERVVQATMSESTLLNRRDKAAQQKTDGHLKKAMAAVASQLPKDVYSEFEEIATTLAAVVKRHPSEKHDAETQLRMAFKKVHLDKALPALADGYLKALGKGLKGLAAPGSTAVDVLLDEFMKSVGAEISNREALAAQAKPTSLFEALDQDDLEDARRADVERKRTAQGTTDVPKADPGVTPQNARLGPQPRPNRLTAAGPREIPAHAKDALKTLMQTGSDSVRSLPLKDLKSLTDKVELVRTHLQLDRLAKQHLDNLIHEIQQIELGIAKSLIGDGPIDEFDARFLTPYQLESLQNLLSDMLVHHAPDVLKNIQAKVQVEIKRLKNDDD